MGEETRNEIETVKNRITELAHAVRTLQDLARQHHKAIKALNDILDAE